jgi:hypothetical protein
MGAPSSGRSSAELWAEDKTTRPAEKRKIGHVGAKPTNLEPIKSNGVKINLVLKERRVSNHCARFTNIPGNGRRRGIIRIDEVPVLFYSCL